MLQWYKRGAAYEPLTFHETFMRLFGTKSEKSHLLYISIYQCITKSFKVKNDTLTLFFQKKHLRARDQHPK